MIQVTLQFSTIAAAVAALAKIPEADAAFAAVTGVSADEKSAVLGTTPTAAPGKSKGASSAAKTAPSPTTAAAAPSPSAPSPAAPAPAPTATPPAAAAGSAADKVDYPTLQKAVFKLVGLVKAAGNDPQVEVLGIARKLAGADDATFKELPPELWKDALDQVQAKTLQLEAA